MKKLLVLLSAILLIFAVGCSNDNPAPDGGTLPGIPDSAPQDYTPVPEEDRGAVVSSALNFIPAIFQEKEVQDLMVSGGGSNEAGTLLVSASQTSETKSVSLSFDGFALPVQEIGQSVSLWGTFTTTSSSDSTTMSDNTQSFNIVAEISGMGTYHLEGSIGATAQKIYLNGDLVDISNQQ